MSWLISCSLIYSYVHNSIFLRFLRVGELTFCQRSPDALQPNQVVQLVESSGHITGLKITFTNFKHSYNQNKNISITLSCRSNICPVQALLDYLALRGLENGPLFRTQDGQAVSRKLFTDHLAILFRACGLDSTRFEGHSFRIGAATFAANVAFPMPKFV